MSFPNIPNITPEINLDCEDAVNLILSSIALEEQSISNIINAESEKIQHVLCMSRHQCANLAEIKAINESAEKIIADASRLEMLLQMKTQNVLELKKFCCPENPCCKPPCCENSCGGIPCCADPTNPCRNRPESGVLFPCVTYKMRLNFLQELANEQTQLCLLRRLFKAERS